MDYQTNILLGKVGLTKRHEPTAAGIWNSDDCYPAQLVNWLQQQNPTATVGLKATDFALEDA